MDKSTQRLFLLLSDAAAFVISFVLYFNMRASGEDAGLLLIVPLVIIVLYWFILFLFSGLYKVWFTVSRLEEIISLFKTTLTGTVILFFTIYLDDTTQGETSGTRFVIFYYWMMLFGMVVTGRMIIRSLQRAFLIRGYGRRRTALIGCGEKAMKLASQLFQLRALGLDMAGFISDDPEIKNSELIGYPVLGSVEDTDSIIKEYGISEVIVSTDRRDEDLLYKLIGISEDRRINLKIYPDMYEILSGQIKSTQIYGFPLIEVKPMLLTEWEKLAKRLMDVLVSALFLIVVSPVIILTAIAIRLESRGPVFYKQERLGLNGRVFRILKFRSMYQDAESRTGPVWSTKDDPRITRVGKFIRLVRIDEIPQMINVLRGEMSLVGPRPERPVFVEQLAKQIPYYKRRLNVRPGITGWAQVKHKYDESLEDVKQKLRYDLFYVENISLKMDIKILFRTILVVLFGKGHYN